MDSQVNPVEELINKVSSPGDVATTLLGCAIGLAVDIFLLHTSVPVGYMTFLGLSVALGLKKFVDAWLGLPNKVLKKQEKSFAAILKDTGEHLDKYGFSPGAKSSYSNIHDLFREYSELWKIGFLNDEIFRKELGNMIENFIELRYKKIRIEHPEAFPTLKGPKAKYWEI